MDTVETYVAVCTDLSGKEQHRQVDVGTVVTSESLGGVMVITLAQNAREVASISTLGAIFSHFHLTYDTGCHGHDPVQAT